MTPFSLWHQKQHSLTLGAVTPAAAWHEPLWTNAFLRIWAVNFIFCVWQFMLNAIFPFYIEHLGGTKMTVGLVAGGFSCMSIFMRPLAGWFLDNRSRSALLRGGAVGLALISLLFMITPVLSLVVAIRLFSALVYAGASTSSNTNACDTIPQNRFGEGMGFFGLGNTLSSALGPAMGLTLMGAYGFNAPFGLTAFLVVLVIWVARGFPFKKIQRRVYGPGRHHLKLSNLFNASALPASAVMLFASAPFGGVSVFTALYGKTSGLGSGALYFALVALGTGSTRLFSGRLADKKGEQPMVVLGSSSFFLASMLLLWESSACYYLSGLLFGWGFGLLAPAMQTMAVRIVPIKKRGAASSTFLCSYDIGYAIGGITAGWLATAWGYRPMFGALSVFTVVAVLIYTRWASKTPSAFKVYQRNRQKNPEARL